MYKPKYSGPGATGICVCGCSWEDHHCGMAMNLEYVAQTGEAYIPDECTNYGFNEVGGMKYNEETQEWEDHCYGYRDSGLTKDLTYPDGN
jgi:hypothetical protein